MNSALPDESADSLDPALLDMVGSELLSALPKEAHVPSRVEGAVKIDVEPAGRARMICVVLKSNIDKYQCNETQLLTEAIFD